MNGGKKKTIIATFAILTAVVAITAARTATGAEKSGVSPSISSFPPTDADPEFLLVWAENLLAAQCMAEAGHPLIVEWPDDDAPKVDPYTEMYGTTDIAAAFRNGYRINPQLHRADPKGSDPNRTYLESLSPAEDRDFQLAYFGDPTDAIRVETDDGWLEIGGAGCLADARIRLHGNLAEWARLDIWANSLHPRAHTLVIADKAYQDILASWRECMGRHGYSVTDPGESRSQVAAQIRAVGATKALDVERSVASADALCNSETDLREQSVELHDQFIAQIISADQALADAYRNRRTAATVIAEELAADFV